MFRAYVDPLPAAAADLFDRLAKLYSPRTPIAGVGDQAYFDPKHGLHARQGKVRFFIELSPISTFTPAIEKQLKDLANRVAGQL